MADDNNGGVANHDFMVRIRKKAITAPKLYRSSGVKRFFMRCPVFL